MTFKAKYIERHGTKHYWKTIYADSLNEAVNQAERWTRKGFIMIGVTCES